MGTLYQLKNPKQGFRFAKDLSGHPPIGHPEIMRGPRGGVILDVGQVWVTITLEEELWVIVSIQRTVRKGTYKHDVTLAPFNNRDSKFHRKISEQTMRSTMHVWNDYIQPQVDRIERLTFLAESGDRTYQELCKFLDLNPVTGEPHPE